MATLDRLMREEAWQPLSADLPVLRSSNELVEALKREMRDCVGRVTRGRALLDLAAVFQVQRWGCHGGYVQSCAWWAVCSNAQWLRTSHARASGCASCPPYLQRVYRAYAARLTARLPKPASGSLGGTAVLGTTDWHVRMSDEDIGVVCLLVSTAEHCQEMVQQLARALAAKLVPPELGSRCGCRWGGAGGHAQPGSACCLPASAASWPAHRPPADPAMPPLRNRPLPQGGHERGGG